LVQPLLRALPSLLRSSEIVLGLFEANGCAPNVGIVARLHRRQRGLGLLERQRGSIQPTLRGADAGRGGANQRRDLAFGLLLARRKLACRFFAVFGCLQILGGLIERYLQSDELL
jgi:hypothetical protein